MTDRTLSPRERRSLAAAFAVCALAALTLLANHPSNGGQTFADVLKDEAHNQFMDGIVHGGFIATLSVLIVCFTLLCRYLGFDRVSIIAALVAFCIGSAAIMGSMVIDGLITPAVAVRFDGADTPEKLAMARTILILCGMFIRFLMPMGLIFQSVGMLGWSLALAGRRGLARAAGVYGILVGIVLLAVLLFLPPAMGEHVLLGGIVLQSIWYLLIAGTLLTAKER